MNAKKILLAEDDLDDQGLFTSFLQHRIDIDIMSIAGSGIALCDMLELIKENDQLPDLIILDQNMPRLNGLQTLQLLKGIDRYADIPMVVYSTYIDENLKGDCMAKGAFDVVSKPINKDGYNKMIDLLLKKILAK